MNEIAIIGAGPAGIGAAIQLARYDLKPNIFEKNIIGGLLWNANLVENYPGFPKGISGPNLARLFNKQLSQLSIPVIQDEILSMQQMDDRIVLNGVNMEYLADYVIVATGTKPVKVPDYISVDLTKRIKRDAVDLFSIEGKHIVIIGGGDAAFDQALSLSKRNKISILNRSIEKKCNSILEARALRNQNIRYFDGMMVKSIEEKNNNVSTLNIIFSRNGHAEESINCDEVLLAIGREPNLDIQLQNIIDYDRLFFIGDIVNGLFKQVSIAVGDGVKTAMNIYQLLNSR